MCNFVERSEIFYHYPPPLPVKDDDDDEKVIKLTNLLKEKNSELLKLKQESKSAKTTMKDNQFKLNEANNKIEDLTTKNKKLNQEVNNLIDACGGQPETEEIENDNFIPRQATAASRRSSGNFRETQGRSQEKKADYEMEKRSKCRFNDKGSCHNGSSCRFVHSSIVCKSFSKYGTCENQPNCLERHPNGTCVNWNRGQCSKDLECNFRHPVDAFDNQSNRSFDRRGSGQKRTLSPHSYEQEESSRRHKNLKTDRNDENSFLFKAYMDVKKELEEQKVRNQRGKSPPKSPNPNFPTGWTPQQPTWPVPNTPVQGQWIAAPQPFIHQQGPAFSDPAGRVQIPGLGFHQGMPNRF